LCFDVVWTWLNRWTDRMRWLAARVIYMLMICRLCTGARYPCTVQVVNGGEYGLIEVGLRVYPIIPVEGRLVDQELISYRYSSCSCCVSSCRGYLFTKAQGSVVSNRIGMKFGRIVLQVNRLYVWNGFAASDFWFEVKLSRFRWWRHFKKIGSSRTTIYAYQNLRISSPEMLCPLITSILPPILIANRGGPPLPP